MSSVVERHGPAELLNGICFNKTNIVRQSRPSCEDWNPECRHSFGGQICIMHLFAIRGNGMMPGYGPAHAICCSKWPKMFFSVERPTYPLTKMVLGTWLLTQSHRLESRSKTRYVTVWLV
jgi:hypothetical protein